MAVTTTYGLTTVQSQIVANGWTNGDQFGSEVVGLSNGGYAVVYGTDVANDYPIATFYDADFNVVNSVAIPYSGTPIDMQGDPEIIELSNGNVAIIWDQGANATNNPNEVVGTIMNSAGGIVHSQFQVSGFSSDSDPEATALSNGNFVVTMSSGSQIYTQIMSATGTKVGGQVSTGIGTDTDPVVTALADGGFVVTYTVNEGVTTGDSIYGEIYNADGTVRTADFEIGFNSNSNDNDSSAVAALSNGNWVVVYKDSGWSGDGLSLHVYDPNGVQISGPTRIDTDINPIETDPDVTVLANDFIVVSWTDPAGAGNILARVYDETGAVVAINGSTSPFTITATGTADTDSSISHILSGLFVNTWSDTNPDADGNSISSEVNEIFATITSDAGSDTLAGSNIRDIMDGNGGSDTMQAFGGNDYMEGGFGNDTMFGGNGTDEMYGESGIDTMYGGAGEDEMHGGDAGDDMRGQNDDDLMYGDGGNDTMRGGGGEDTIYGGINNDEIFGNDDNDVLYGNSGGDRLNGGSGNDIAYGGTDSDRLYGIDGNDTLYGEAGNDFLYGGTGNDTMFGGNQDDRMYGNENNDIMFGGSGADTLIGGTGNDELSGGLGDDLLRGQDGADTFSYGSTFDYDRVLDFQDDVDTIELNQNLWGGGLTVAQVLSTFGTQTSPVTYTLDFGSGDVLDITGFAISPVSAGDLLNDITLI